MASPFRAGREPHLKPWKALASHGVMDSKLLTQRLKVTSSSKWGQCIVALHMDRGAKPFNLFLEQALDITGFSKQLTKKNT